jgi:hypothetical protein
MAAGPAATVCRAAAGDPAQNPEVPGAAGWLPCSSNRRQPGGATQVGWLVFQGEDLAQLSVHCFQCLLAQSSG